MDYITTSHSEALSATADPWFYAGHGQAGEWKLVGVTLVPTVAVTASGSAKWVVAVTDGSSTVCTSFDTSSTALVVGTAAEFTMTGTAGTALEFGVTDSVKFVATKTGSPNNLDCQMLLRWQKVRV